MIEEYNICKNIFETNDKEILKENIDLIISSEIARDYVYSELLKYKLNPKYMYKININIDNIEDYPIELLANKIVENIKKEC